MADWTLRPLSHADTDAVLALWSTRLGDDYPDPAKLDAALRPDSDTLCFVAIGESEELLGFAIGLVLSSAEVQDKLDCTWWPTGETGLLDTNCVAEHAAGNGIGTALTERRLSEFENRGITRFLSISWQRDDAPDSSGVLERVGFEARETIENFWYEDSLEHGYDCPDCGNPCTCAARIYTKTNSAN